MGGDRALVSCRRRDSGRSYAPHLHVHAQTLPYPAVGKADGIPIRFSAIPLPKIGP
jgi:hypothetical protein